MPRKVKPLMLYGVADAKGDVWLGSLTESLIMAENNLQEYIRVYCKVNSRDTTSAKYFRVCQFELRPITRRTRDGK